MVTMTTRATKRLATCKEERKSLLQTSALPKAPLGGVRGTTGHCSVLCERMFASESRQRFADLTDNPELPSLLSPGAKLGCRLTALLPCPTQGTIQGPKMGLGREEILL